MRLTCSGRIYTEGPEMKPIDELVSACDIIMVMGFPVLKDLIGFLIILRPKK